jgi:hypothetical protein
MAYWSYLAFTALDESTGPVPMNEIWLTLIAAQQMVA